MHVWTVVLGRSPRSPREALEPVDTRDQDVMHAAGLQVVEDLHPELRALGLLEPHAQHVTITVKRHAQGEVERAALHAAALADLQDHAVQEHDRVDVLQWPLGPLAHIVHDRVGHLADQLTADLHAVDLLQVRGDVPCGEPAAVEREDLLVEPDEPALALADDLRLEAAVAVTRCIERHRPVLGHKRLSRRAVALVLRAAGRLLMRLVTEMVSQLDLHRPLQQTLGQIGEQPAGPGDLLLVLAPASSSSITSSLIRSDGTPRACRTRRRPTTRSTASSTSSGESDGGSTTSAPPPVLSGRPPGSLRSPAAGNTSS